MVAVSGCVSATPSGVATPHEVLRLLVEDTRPPAADRDGWEHVALPDFWRPSAGRRSSIVGTVSLLP